MVRSQMVAQDRKREIMKHEWHITNGGGSGGADCITNSDTFTTITATAKNAEDDLPL